MNPRSTTLPSRSDIVAENERLFQAMALTAPDAVGNQVKRILQNRARYEAAEATSGIKWYMVALLHALESSLRFDRHLHNGDPLSARTMNVPASRPTTGQPPYTWEVSAADALAFLFPEGARSGLASVGGILYAFERINGLGYRSRNVPSPYVWGCTNVYAKGKFVSNGVFDPEAVCATCGAAAILKLLIDEGQVDLKVTGGAAAGFGPARN